MIQKVLGSVFVLAVALGMISVAVRPQQTTPVKARPASAAPGLAPESRDADPIMKKDTPHMERATASYRVYEYGIERGMDFRGAGYTARVSEEGVRFGMEDGSLLLGTPKIEQGSKSIETSAPTFAHPAFGVARLERGAVAEEYVFENRRMEQLFHIAAPLGEGALTVRVPLATTFPSVVETRVPHSGKFELPQFANGGVAVLDVTGAIKFTCTSAVVFDAAGARLTLSPRHENNEIVLAVPASFMAKAAYPVVIDPWFATNSTGGISNTASASERPAMKDNVIAWADASAGNFEIYVKVWNGGDFVELAGSASGGGISANPGMSVNPTVVSDGSGSPTVAWEDTTSGFRSIFLKQYPPRGKGTTWQELAGSATGLGLSGSFGTNQHPTVGLLKGVIPGQVSVGANGTSTSTPATTVFCPVVAWESGSIFVSAFYPGAPQIPAIGLNPALPPVPAGWYQLGAPGGQNVNKDIFNPFLTADSGTGGAYPNLVVDALNQVTVTWQSTFSGNYEICASRWTLNAGVTSTDFQVVAFDSQRFDMQPAADFAGIAAPGAAFDVVSNTTTPSQYPAIALDDFGGLNIVWQETESIPGPNPATSSQIYMRQSIGGAWNSVAGSASAGGISRTGLAYDGAGQTPPVPGNAGHPAIDAYGGYIGVAWEDTSNSRSSIYVRRCVNPGGATWEQIGFQGSAFPPRLPLILPPAVPEQAPISGVSQSPNYAFQPQIQIGGDSSTLVVWADGAGTAFDIHSASFWPNGPGIAAGIGTTNPTFQLTIRQTLTDPSSLLVPAVDVPLGDFTAGTTIWLSSRVFSETLTPAGFSLWLEFEIQPVGIPFTGTPTHQSLFVAPDLPPTVLPAPAATSLSLLQFDGLPNTNYHYRTRSIDQIGRHSPWFEQTSNGVSFRVNAAGAVGGGSNGPSNAAPIVGSSSSKGSCGLLGLDAIALLGVLGMIRRRRFSK